MRNLEVMKEKLMRRVAYLKTLPKERKLLGPWEIAAAVAVLVFVGERVCACINE